MAALPTLPELRFESHGGVVPDSVRKQLNGPGPLPESVPVSYVVLRCDGHVLLQLRQGTGYMDGQWSTAAAGRVESGETAVEAAIREAREELGIDIAAQDLIPLTTMHRSEAQVPPAKKRIDHFFSCDAWSGIVRIMEPDKNAALKWFSLHSLPEALVTHERHVLERLRSGLPSVTSSASAEAPAESGAP